MKLITLALLTVMQIFMANAQNVGIGTSSPNERLDVNGNINMSGNLRVNGVAGLAGQVLATGANGSTAWINAGDYKNGISFKQNDSWTIPAGVTKIRIEAWGAGGGGAFGGGGAGGTYCITSELAVIPGTVLTISIGIGGDQGIGLTGTGNTGGSTTVTGPDVYVLAIGGGGAFASAPGYPSSTSAGLNIIQIPGHAGEPTSLSFAQKSSGTFVQLYKHGNGGGVAPYYNISGFGGTSIFNETGTTLLQTLTPSALYNVIGCGGGGGVSGAKAANGFVVIHW
ncbi:MAG: glycine-rich domain-containing protein [Ferruginibacter sp.]